MSFTWVYLIYPITAIRNQSASKCIKESANGYLSGHLVLVTLLLNTTAGNHEFLYCEKIFIFGQEIQFSCKFQFSYFPPITDWFANGQVWLLSLTTHANFQPKLIWSVIFYNSLPRFTAIRKATVRRLAKMWLKIGINPLKGVLSVDSMLSDRAAVCF